MEPRIPTTRELWKNEKTRYRHWVIILAIGLLVIASLTIASFILNLIDRDAIVANLKQNYLENNENGTETKAAIYANNNFVQYNIVYASLILIALSAGIIWYFVSLADVYKHKNFAKLSPWPTLIVGVGAIISFIQLMNFLISREDRSLFLSSDGSIMTFASRIIYILIYLVASSPISRVRRIFAISDRLEKMHNDPQFQAMQRQMNNNLGGGHMPNGPFGPVVANDQNVATPNNPTNNQENNVSEEVKVDPELERLKKLPIGKLREVALKLSISGYNEMKKDELITAIIRVTKK